MFDNPKLYILYKHIYLLLIIINYLFFFAGMDRGGEYLEEFQTFARKLKRTRRKLFHARFVLSYAIDRASRLTSQGRSCVRSLAVWIPQRNQPLKSMTECFDSSCFPRIEEKEKKKRRKKDHYVEGSVWFLILYSPIFSFFIYVFGR